MRLAPLSKNDIAGSRKLLWDPSAQAVLNTAKIWRSKRLIRSSSNNEEICNLL